MWSDHDCGSDHDHASTTAADDHHHDRSGYYDHIVSHHDHRAIVNQHVKHVYDLAYELDKHDHHGAIDDIDYYRATHDDLHGAGYLVYDLEHHDLDHDDGPHHLDYHHLYDTP